MLCSGKDLSVDPATRGVSDVKHELAAAASSTSKSRAEDFLRKCGAKLDAHAHGSYNDLVNDPDVDIVYIASPHSHHYQNAMLCLLAGKHVLCEKALTVNALQAEKLVTVAKEKELLLMEALWTRYFPLSQYVRDLIASGRIGPVQRVLAEHSLPYAGLERSDEKEHIMVNPRLAGGILLDSGIYSLTWIFQSLYSNQSPSTRQRPVIKSASAIYEATGVDSMATIILDFPRATDQGGHAHGVATASLGLSIDDIAAKQGIPDVRIQGPKGEIQIFPPSYRPKRTRLVLKDGTVEDVEWPYPGPGAASGWYNGFGSNLNPEGEGHGLFWEADDAARALRDGRTEGSQLGHEESILIMQIMDEVRREAGLRYPEPLESTEYPLEL